MSVTTIEDEIRDVIRGLSPVDQKQVLNFVRGLNRNIQDGISGAKLIALAHEINFDPEDLAQMEQAIEEWCERIDEPTEVTFDE